MQTRWKQSLDIENIVFLQHEYVFYTSSMQISHDQF